MDELSENLAMSCSELTDLSIIGEIKFQNVTKESQLCKRKYLLCVLLIIDDSCCSNSISAVFLHEVKFIWNVYATWVTNYIRRWHHCRWPWTTFKIDKNNVIIFILWRKEIMIYSVMFWERCLWILSHLWCCYFRD